ncbi:WhiB family transcriptional regulator [Streptomyces sp. NPDC058252]|uniref:WhiB family transcriptional regulator n=1 Tax=Streptomyces sp. NPDC058252 TaxID=3346405 RepID=UPI0036EADABD
MVMRLRVNAPEWDGGGNPEMEASCRKFRPTRDHDDFFGDGTGSQYQAKQICNGTYTDRVCPLREQCLQFALVNNEHYGVWGGLNALERAYIRKFVPKNEWSFDRAPSREDLEREWPNRVNAADFEDEADGEDGEPGGDEEEPLAAAG